MLLARLLGHQAGIDAVPRHQRVVPSLFGDLAAVEDENAVAVDHARQPMGEDQRRAALHQPVERFLDHRLVLGIDGRQRLVEHQDRRVAQQGAGDGDALALAARELDALLADRRLITLRQAPDEVVDVGRARRLDQLLVRGVGPAEANVLLDGAVEQEGVLVHHRDQRADLGKRQGAEIMAA